MKIFSHRIEYEGHYPILIVETDLGTLEIMGEQKLYLKYRALHCGAHMEGKLPEIGIPEDPSNSQAEMILTNFTDDPRILKLYRETIYPFGDLERKDFE